MTGRSSKTSTSVQGSAHPVFPFTAIVGQDEMKLALLLNVVAPSVGGVLISGHRGTGKSTAVRSLAELLPPIAAVRGCAFNCDPADADDLCDACRELRDARGRLSRGRRAVPVVELPLGATEDRVCGTIDLARALKEGEKAFEPGLLARANRGFLYIDEVNLLDDHLVDLLLDVAATGRHRVEREGVSAEHAARFVLIGSANPEEGELRPQLLDRFGLCVEVETVGDLDQRVLIVERREAFERDPAAFAASFEAEQERLRRRLARARRGYGRTEVPRALLRSIAELCARLGADGHRGELTIARAARALAAFEGRRRASADDVRRVAAMSLRHRLRRDPLEQSGGGARVEHSVEEVFGPPAPSAEGVDDASRDAKDSPPASPARHGRGGGGSLNSRRTHRTRGENSFDGDGRSTSHTSPERVLPPAEVDLRSDAGARLRDAGPSKGKFDLSGRTKAAASARRAGGVRRTVNAPRGRYVGATPDGAGARSVALDATLRAAASSSATRRRAGDAAGSFSIEHADLRFKRFRARAGTLFIFAVDTSGSMALNRIRQAKGALAHLLRQSYVNRDRVALVSFRQKGAETLLAPSGSALRARRILDALPVGGATPLAAGLLRALHIARRAEPSKARRVRLVVFTDGRANVPLTDAGREGRDGLKARLADEIKSLGAALGEVCVSSLVVDTQRRFTAGDEGRALASALGGRYVQLPQLITERTVSEVLAEDE